MEDTKKIIISTVVSAILPFIIINLGIKIISDFPEKPWLGITMIVLAFLTFYFFLYTTQIRKNENSIKELQEQITIMQNKNELNKKALNTIKDIVILEDIKKRKKK
ncbi:hypothetical protein CMI48_03265 [Candidatus Pacearchaeota archaeon]|nr:hypothetical protein [Candidatus Pacearchaeota archaeon]